MSKEITINDMRKHIIESYPNESKFKEVIINMPDNSIMAIYKSVVAREELIEEPSNNNHPMNIWESMLDSIKAEDSRYSYNNNLLGGNIHDQRSKGNE